MQQQPYIINYSNKMSSERLNRADGLVDHNIPVNSPIIWELSQEVREWKFLARNLDLEKKNNSGNCQYTNQRQISASVHRLGKQCFKAIVEGFRRSIT